MTPGTRHRRLGAALVIAVLAIHLLALEALTTHQPPVLASVGTLRFRMHTATAPGPATAATRAPAAPTTPIARAPAPERDTPGKMASTWQSPIWNALDSGSRSPSLKRGSGRWRSSTRIRIPPSVSKTAITSGAISRANSTSLMKPCSVRPATTEGMKATRTLSTKCRESAELGSVTATPQNFRQ